jgi:hypothetical protein
MRSIVAAVSAAICHQQRVVGIRRLDRQRIERGAAQAPRSECLGHIRFVQQPAPRRVDQERPGLHPGDRLAIEKAAVGRVHRAVQADDIAFGQKLSQRQDGKSGPARAGRGAKARGDDPHAQRFCHLADATPDPARPDNTQRLAAKLGRPVGTAIPDTGLQPHIEPNDIATDRQDQGDRHFRRRIGIGIARRHHGDVARRGSGEVDAVDPCPHLGDQGEIGGGVEHGGIERWIGTHQDGVETPGRQGRDHAGLVDRPAHRLDGGADRRQDTGCRLQQIIARHQDVDGRDHGVDPVLRRARSRIRPRDASASSPCARTGSRPCAAAGVAARR